MRRITPSCSCSLIASPPPPTHTHIQGLVRPLPRPNATTLPPSPPGASQLSFKSPAAADATSNSLALQLWHERRLVSELLVPKAAHGALVNDGYFASGAAWSTSEDLIAYTAEVWGGKGGGRRALLLVPTIISLVHQQNVHTCSHFQVSPSEKTPAWCGPESLKDRAGPKSWRGVGAALEDWGELNTGECVCVGGGMRVGGLRGCGGVAGDWGELNTVGGGGGAWPFRRLKAVAGDRSHLTILAVLFSPAGKRAPAVFVLDTVRSEVVKVRAGLLVGPVVGP